MFSKNRERLLNQDVAQAFFSRVLTQAKPHLSDEHFTVDGTLIEAWASQKSFQKKDGGDGDGSQFRGERRSNDTHESKTDPGAKLYRKGSGQEAKLGYLGHVLMENRNGLIVDAMVTQADGTAERDAALLMVHRKWRRNRRWGSRKPISVGADKAYDTRDFVWISIPLIQVSEHGLFQFSDGGMAAPPHAAFGHFGEQPLNQIQPTSARGREMDVVTGMAH